MIQFIKTRRNAEGQDVKWTYPDKVIPLINPVLRCYFVESHAADKFYSKNKLYDISVNFLDYSLRRELLMVGVSQFNLKLFEGKWSRPYDGAGFFRVFRPSPYTRV